jgi:hypothetical protein
MNPLQRLMSDEVSLLGFTISDAESLSLALEATAAVRALRLEIVSGVVSVELLEASIHQLLGAFEIRKSFPWDTQLAAIAVAVCNWQCEFAERFLNQLSAVSAAEMPLSPKVAKIVLRRRAQAMPPVSIKQFRFAKIDGAQQATPIFVPAQTSSMQAVDTRTSEANC